MNQLTLNDPVQLEQTYAQQANSSNAFLATPGATSSSVGKSKQETIEQIKFVAPKRLKLPNVPSTIILNTKAKEIQAKLSDQGKYVNWQEILYELCEMYNCQHIGELDLAQADHLEAIKDLIRLQKQVDSFIIMCDLRAPFITLVDLEKNICYNYNYIENKRNEKVSTSAASSGPKQSVKVRHIYFFNLTLIYSKRCKFALQYES